MMTALNSVFPVIKSATAATNLIEAYRLAHFFFNSEICVTWRATKKLLLHAGQSGCLS